MTNSIEEILGAELLFVIGSNATEAHPIIGNKMKQAVKKGTKLIVVDPRKTGLAEEADIWLRLNPGTDVFLLNAMMKVIIEEGLEAKDYIESRVENFEGLKKTVMKYDLDEAEKVTGVDKELIRQAALLYAKTEKAGIFYTLGITEHTHGTENVMSLANLGMLTGHVGIESGGINPIRGQNNVQGACDLGALPNTYPAYAKVTDPKAREFFESVWKTPLSPNLGYQIPEMFNQAVKGNVKAMYIMGEDPVLSDPDANHVKRALNNLDLLVVQDIFMSDTAKLADVVFPATCYAEKDGTFTNTERRVQRVRKAVAPPGQARNDWSILCDVSKIINPNVFFDYETSEDVFEEMRVTMPSYRGMTYERIDKVGLQWPCPTTSHPGTKYLHKGIFARGQGQMMEIEYRPSEELPDEDYPMILSTGRMLYHYNITTRYSKDLDGVSPYELAEINPVDAERLGVKDLDTIRVTSRRGSIVTRVVVTDRVLPNMIFMTFHYRESPVNEVTSNHYDPITGTGEYKVCAIHVEKVDLNPDHEDTIQRFVNMATLLSDEHKKDKKVI